MSNKIIVDLDWTLSISKNKDYRNAIPDKDLIEKLHYYKKKGFEIIIHSSRNMRTYEGNITKINKNTLPIMIEWLDRNKVPYDGVFVGKPWCGNEGFYVDLKNNGEEVNLKISESSNVKVKKTSTGYQVIETDEGVEKPAYKNCTR